jgi:1-acyl-sn-glycerol-3-phosphate acyltransferase
VKGRAAAVVLSAVAVLPAVAGVPALAARGRRALWRGVFTLTGGLRVQGAAALPAGPCVVVANHCSHADTAALIAALPARRQPAVAAAADYWFQGGMRPAICRLLCAAFPVRRSGGGSADLAAAARLLASGRDVIVFPEGSRSRDGRTAEFHRGAARLAAAAGAPLVPVGISGTGTLLPPQASGRRRQRTTVIVRIGAPVCVAELAERLVGADGSGADAAIEATAQARARVVALLADGDGSSGVTPGCGRRARPAPPARCRAR